MTMSTYNSIFKKMLIVTLSVMLTRVPQLQAAAEAQGKMISTVDWVNEQSRKEMEAKVTQFMNREDVATQLTQNGVNPTEAQMRVASLSDAELQHLSSEIDKSTYGGSVAGVLIIVVLVLLIIYLAKRV